MKLSDSDTNLKIKCTLINFYGVCGEIDKALKLFELNTNKNNIVLVSAMMSAYLCNGLSKDALELYQNIDISDTHIKKDVISHCLALKACMKSNNFESGKNLCKHFEFEFEKGNIRMQTALIEFYGHFGEISSLQ